MAHAILSASGSSRWMACTPSARLEQLVSDAGSIYAAEGTLAHEIGETILRSPNKELSKKQLAAFKKHELFSAELLRYAEEYAAYVLDHLPEGGLLLVEHALDTSNYIEEGFGTMDAGIIYTAAGMGILETFDLKYGKGVPVYAENNKQAMIYALGVLNDFGHIYQIDVITMHIYQPRINNTTNWSITTEALLDWADIELKPKAQLAFAGEGEFVPGPHCGFCKIKAKCRALAQHNLELAKHDFVDPPLLDDDELLEIYKQAPLFESWIKAVGEFVFKEALKGKKWDGYKVVEGKSNRVYASPGDLEADLRLYGYQNIYKPKTLLPMGEMETAIGRQAFRKIVSPALKKPPGKPTLVNADDKRPEYSSALTDFDDNFNFEEEPWEN